MSSCRASFDCRMRTSSISCRRREEQTSTKRGVGRGEQQEGEEGQLVTACPFLICQEVLCTLIFLRRSSAMAKSSSLWAISAWLPSTFYQNPIRHNANAAR
eukprot:1338992-Rhodomonas_salina.1